MVNNYTLNYEDDIAKINGDFVSIENFQYPVTMSEETARRYSEETGRNRYNLLDVSYGIYNDNNRMEINELTIACHIVGCKGYSSYSKLESNLVTDGLNPIPNMYGSKYFSGNVVKEFSKEYGSDIEIARSVIKHSKIRDDKRSFGLKFAKPGIYHKDKKLVYLDFKNFYPNILVEYGAMNGFDVEKFKKLIRHGSLKLVMNKLIGRFDAEYSLFYNHEYANNLRLFGRMKLLYYIDQCFELLFCNTDSILAYVNDDFEIPEGAVGYELDNVLIKNIGNYVFQSNDILKTAGLFNKVEELTIALERMGIEQDPKYYSVRTLFGIDIDGYISANDVPIPGLNRKSRYGYSKKLNIKPLISIQENI